MEGVNFLPHEEAVEWWTHGWLHPRLGGGGGGVNPRYLQKAHSLPLNEIAGVGSRGISQRNTEEEMGWTDASLLHHLHLPFPFSVYFLPRAYMHVCVAV